MAKQIKLRRKQQQERQKCVQNNDGDDERGGDIGGTSFSVNSTEPHSFGIQQFTPPPIPYRTMPTIAMPIPIMPVAIPSHNAAGSSFQFQHHLSRAQFVQPSAPMNVNAIEHLLQGLMIANSQPQQLFPAPLAQQQINLSIFNQLQQGNESDALTALINRLNNQ